MTIGQRRVQARPECLEAHRAGGSEHLFAEVALMVPPPLEVEKARLAEHRVVGHPPMRKESEIGSNGELLTSIQLSGRRSVDLRGHLPSR